MKKLKLTIDGMHCASCASNVERSLKKIEGIKEVSVSVLTKKAFVETEKEIPQEALKEAIKRVGYNLTSVEVA